MSKYSKADLTLAVKKATKSFINACKRHYERISHLLFHEDADNRVLNLPDMQEELTRHVMPAMRFGLMTVLAAFLIFGLWAGTAALDSAAIAGGVVVLSNNRKVIQHIEGGTIEKILIKEGDKVKKNQALMILDDSMAKAKYLAALSALRNAAAIEARLNAEEKEEKNIDFAEFPVLHNRDLETQKVIEMQKSVFETRRREYESSNNIVDKQSMQKQESLNGYNEQLIIYEQIFEADKGKLEDVKTLLAKGFATKHQVLELEKNLNSMRNQILGVKTNILSIKQEIEEIELRKLNMKNRMNTEIAEEYRKNHANLLDLQQQADLYKKMLDRTIVKSPADGIITGLRYHTEKGIVSAQSVIAEVVPLNDDLIIDAQVPTIEANHLHVGMPVKVQLNSYKQRLVPRLRGEVIYVSADRMMADNGGGAGRGRGDYFLIKIKIDPSEMKSLNSEVKLFPGMPVTVFVVRGTRTLLEYLVSPIVDSLHKSFKVN
jgi:HlyD family secretion protein